MINTSKIPNSLLIYQSSIEQEIHKIQNYLNSYEYYDINILKDEIKSMISHMERKAHKSLEKQHQRISQDIQSIVQQLTQIGKQDKEENNYF